MVDGCGIRLEIYKSTQERKKSFLLRHQFSFMSWEKGLNISFEHDLSKKVLAVNKINRRKKSYLFVNLFLKIISCLFLYSVNFNRNVKH